MRTIGNQSIIDRYVGEQLVIRRYVGEQLVYERNTRRLPKGYILVNYLQSTGQQTIDTGWRSVGLKYRLECVFEMAQSNAGVSLFGARSNTPSVTRSGSYYFGTADRPSSYIGTTTNQWTLPAATPLIVGTEYFLSFEANELGGRTFRRQLRGDDGIINLDNSTTFTGSTITQDGHHIFGAITAGVAGERGYFKVKSFKAFDEDVISRDMVPCLDNTGKPCMYCFVTKQTFYNSSGSANFLYG